MKGTVKRIMYEKNFGFLSVEDEEKDIFFHRSGVKEDFNDLRDGEEVEFDLEDTDRGPQATNIVKV
ncbi:MAG: cold shock domain-containing protein [Candidatus Heimdallarchaeota archaeon]|nr:cold shock domain-containing protein [Candidatus Heimdallarchaeota archaeon]MCK5409122.1 cold shock domain-containing protein [Candidatus Heimdallarchaeota archaeon]